MPSGTLQTVLVCIPAPSASAADQQICPHVDAQYYVPSRVQAYLIDVDQASLLESVTGPFDYGYASAVWALAFTTVVGLFLVSHSIGLLLGFIRRG